MSITTINSSTFISDLVNFIKTKLIENITDPLASKRVTNEKFILTEYPRRAVNYPIITVTDRGTKQQSGLGMGSEGTILRLGVEIRIWARNVVERDQIFGEVYDYLRTNQLTGDDITGANLHDFSMGSVVNVSEENIKSKVMEANYLFICV
jgi:hypothetical protein